MLRNLGTMKVPAVGLGCMGMSEFYGEVDDANSVQVLTGAFDAGYRHFDTADMYGRGHNEELLARFLGQMRTHREDMVIATKFGIRRDGDDKAQFAVDCRPEYVRQACERSLTRLGTDVIDLYYAHRRDPSVPIEDTVGAMGELVTEGKVKGIGLSEVSVTTLRAAQAVHPIAAVQSEYSLWTRDPEQGMLKATAGGTTAFVAYSPLGRGFLAGRLTKDYLATADASLDFRPTLPRFGGANLDANLALLDKLVEISTGLGWSKAQVALAWVLGQGQHIHVIPGTKQRAYLSANFDAQHLRLPAGLQAELDQTFSATSVRGDRYPEKLLLGTNL